jgi:cathepsin L
MNKAFIIACLLGLAVCAPKWHQLEGYTFDQYIKDFKKDYTVGSAEYASRKAIFEQQVESIVAFNRDPTQTYKQGVNRHTDLTHNEFKQNIRGIAKGMKNSVGNSYLRSLSASEHQTPTKEEMAALPTNVDWRDHGVVTPVKDQGHCGSCWAFASAATLESHAAINSGSLKTLSTQQLVSCIPNPMSCGGSGGCGGAITELAFSYVQLYGLTSEYKYSYQSYYSGETGACQYEELLPSAEVEADGYIRLPLNDYDALLHAVATVGPVTVSVDASQWKNYESGVFNGCSYTDNIDIDHAVVLVGYGTDETLGDFWLVRNSWGTGYGENGYIRIHRESE